MSESAGEHLQNSAIFCCCELVDFWNFNMPYRFTSFIDIALIHFDYTWWGQEHSTREGSGFGSDGVTRAREKDGTVVGSATPELSCLRKLFSLRAMTWPQVLLYHSMLWPRMSTRDSRLIRTHFGEIFSTNQSSFMTCIYKFVQLLGWSTSGIPSNIDTCR